MGRKITIYDVARAAGVSIATVSRAVNPATRHKVSGEILRTVDRVIAEFGYAPNLAAKSLSSQVFNTIGVLMPHGRGVFLNDYFARLLDGIADALLDTPYRFKLIMLKKGSTPGEHYDFRAAEGVDGLLICHWRAFFSDDPDGEKIRLPYVVLGDPDSRLGGHVVSPDHEQIGRLAAECLLRNGHRRIALMDGSRDSVDNTLRVRGFRDALKRHGIDIEADDVLHGNFVQETAVAAARAWLGAKPKNRCTALFCCNDAMALGVMQALPAFNLRCPDDLSIIGVDDLNASAMAAPPLTSIRQPLQEVSLLATRRLLDLLTGKTAVFPAETTLLPVRLVERASVRNLASQGSPAS
jgi:DNA-binding LacI/PurR family transcriptional regulator